MHFKDRYLTALKSSKVFPTVNNQYIKYLDSAEPKFYQLPFAKILKGDEFKDLLQYTQDERIIKFLGLLGVGIYSPQKYFASKINMVANKLSDNERIEIVKLFVVQYPVTPHNYNDNNNAMYPNLLKDTDGNLITQGDLGLFNQPKGEELSNIPKCVNLKFVNKGDFDIIGKLANFDKEHRIRDIIAKYFRCFGVQEYSFSSLQSTINETSKQLDNCDAVRELLQWVYKIYKTQKDDSSLQTIKLNLNIPINKTEFALASDLYFSKEYENAFYAEFLLKALNGKVKFVGKKNEVGFETENNEDIIRFFKWLGVANSPKAIEIDLQGKNKTEYDIFLNGKNHRNSSCKITTYEFFDEILENMPTGDILKWILDESSKSHSIINKKVESSRFVYRPYNRSNYYDKKSYVCWRLGTEKWVEIANKEYSDEKCSLSDCLLENYELAPYLYHPKIDYQDLKNYNSAYTATRVNSLLEDLGVRITLVDLPFDRFYELLYKLEQIDKDYKVTRRVYDALFNKTINNSDYYEEIKNLDSYKSFIDKGKVLSRKGKNIAFELVQQVFYSDKMDLCKGILYDLSILDMDRGRGEKKVANLFGIKTLDKAEVEITDIVEHNFNKNFQKLLTSIKPFILVHREDKNKEVLSRIKNIKIKLCKQVLIKYALYDNEYKKYSLVPKNCENIFSRSEGNGYICIPDQEVEGNLLKDYSFYASCGELISVILNAKRDKDTFSNLIRDDINTSKKALEDKFGDNWSILLSNAKKDLGETETNEDIFLNIISQLTGAKRDEIKSKIQENFNFEKVDSVQNASNIIDLFSKLQITIKQFNINSDGLITISLEEYYKRLFAQLLQQYEVKYKAYIYQQINGKDLEDKAKEFANKLKEYNFAQLNPNEEKDIDWDVKNQFVELFDVSVSELESIEELDYDEIINSNIEQYKNKNPELYDNISKQHNSERIREVALFGQLDILNVVDNSTTPTPTMESADNTATIQSIIGVNNVELEQRQTVPLIQSKSEMCGQPGVSNWQPNYNAQNKTKLDNGFAAELKVYKELCKKHGKENVKWVSTNATRNDATVAGDDTLHYDIMYFENGDKTKQRYVEVKSSSNSDKIIIKMSKGEFDFGNEHMENYDLHYVVINNLDVVKYYVIREFFKPKDDGRRKYNLIQDAFELLAKVE